MATAIKVKFYSGKSDDSHGAIAGVPVDCKIRLIPELFKHNHTDYPVKIIADTIYIGSPSRVLRLLFYQPDQGHPMKINWDPQRIGGDNTDLTSYSISAKKTS